MQSSRNLKKYRILNSSECLETIPYRAEIYYPNLFLTVYKSGFILNGNICILH